MIEALAIIGAVTGVAGATIALLRFFRDKPKVVVTHAEGGRRSDDGGYESFVALFIANHGRQPIAITQGGVKQVSPRNWRRAIHNAFLFGADAVFALLGRASVAEERLARWRRRLGPSAVLTKEFRWPAFQEPIVLGLGELRKFELADPFSSPLGERLRLWPIYAYAVDSYGRTTLGHAPLMTPPSSATPPSAGRISE